MNSKSSTIKIIGYSLAFLYAFSFVFFMGLLTLPNHKIHSMVIVVCFAVAFLSSVSITLLQDWGRKLLVTVNMLLFVYLVGLQVSKISLIPIGYIFMCLIVALFFNQIGVKALFQSQNYFFRKSVLVVDDDPSLLKTIKPVLLKHGYSVLTAKTGEKGLQIAQMQKPDIIVLDVILPGIKGRQVCAQLKDDAGTKNIPVIFLTAKDSPDDVEAELAAGAVSHITKPFGAQKLLDEIKKAIG